MDLFLTRGLLVSNKIERPNSLKIKCNEDLDWLFEVVQESGSIILGDKVTVPNIYCKDSKGRIQTTSIYLSIDKGTGKCSLDSLVSTEGSTRSFSTPLVKYPPTKEYIKWCVERLTAKVTKKLKGKYATSIELLDQVHKEPVLMYKWEDYRPEKGTPYVILPKLDGVRCLFKKENLESRKGEEINMSNVLKDCLRLGIPLDGELFENDSDFDTISGAVRGSEEGRKIGLKLHVFDSPEEGLTYAERYAKLLDVEWSLYKYLELVPAVVSRDPNETEEHFKNLFSIGYEGGIARLADSKENNGRTKDALKWKPVRSEEFPIVGIDYDLSPGGQRMVKFLLSSPKGIFLAVPRWSHAKRARVYEEITAEGFGDWEGEPMTVEYRELTSKGLPKHAIAIGRRLND